MKKIVVLVSGGGTNLQAIIDAQNNGLIKNGYISCVLSSTESAFALTRAKQNGIDTMVIPRKQYKDKAQYNAVLLEKLKELSPDLIVLAGFMTILSRDITEAFKNKIINVHPALIPSFCGEGYYGMRVHEAVLEYGVKLTGATVHFVNEEADAGAIILQKAIEVKNGDTPEILQKRVMEQAEWIILPYAVSLFCDGKISIVDEKAVVDVE